MLTFNEAFAQNCLGIYAISDDGSKDSNFLRYDDNLDRIQKFFLIAQLSWAQEMLWILPSFIFRFANPTNSIPPY